MEDPTQTEKHNGDGKCGADGKLHNIMLGD
jgi:hypothetical protein